MNKEIHRGRGIGMPQLAGWWERRVRECGDTECGDTASEEELALLRLRRGWPRHSRGEHSGQPLLRSGPRLQLPVVPVPEGPPLWPPQSPAVSRTFPWDGPQNSRATPAAQGAAAGKSCAGASGSRRGWPRSPFPPAPGSPPPSTCI